LAGLPEQHQVEQARDEGRDQGVHCRREFAACRVGHGGGAHCSELLGQMGLMN